MAKIGVLGAGTWGMALSRMLSLSGHEITVCPNELHNLVGISTERCGIVVSVVVVLYHSHDPHIVLTQNYSVLIITCFKKTGKSKALFYKVFWILRGSDWRKICLKQN